MQQLPLLKTPSKQYEACAITGHRSLPQNFSKDTVRNSLIALIEKGVKTFYNGLAVGFDLLTAEILMELKEFYPFIRVCGCVPFYGQERYFPAVDKERYAAVIKLCDEVVTLSDGYYKGCYHKRNLYMIERADVLYAYCLTARGGAAYTVKEFSRLKGKENVIFCV